MEDPAQLALVEKALREGLGGCVEWRDDTTQIRVRNDPLNQGLTPTGIKRLAIDFVRGDGDMRQVVETDDDWKDEYPFWYCIVMPLDGFPSGFLRQVPPRRSGPGRPDRQHRRRPSEWGVEMKPFPRKCATCRQKEVRAATLTSYETTLEHDGRKYPVTLRDVPALQCHNCGTIILGDEADDRLSDALRSAANLLTPGVIRGSREALGLTQKQLAAYLQISESTLSRWETGAQIQQRCMDVLLRLFFGCDQARSYLGAPEHTWQATLATIEDPTQPLQPVSVVPSGGVKTHG